MSIHIELCEEEALRQVFQQRKGKVFVSVGRRRRQVTADQFLQLLCHPANICQLCLALAVMSACLKTVPFNTQTRDFYLIQAMRERLIYPLQLMENENRPKNKKPLGGDQPQIRCRGCSLAKLLERFQKKIEKAI